MRKFGFPAETGEKSKRKLEKKKEKAAGLGGFVLMFSSGDLLFLGYFLFKGSFVVVFVGVLRYITRFYSHFSAQAKGFGLEGPLLDLMKTSLLVKVPGDFGVYLV